MQDISVAEAKAQLARLIHQVEYGAEVRITRRGKPVAVLLSEADYAALKANAPKRTLWDSIQDWRAAVGPDWPDLTADEVDSWRDRDTGRSFEWPR